MLILKINISKANLCKVIYYHKQKTKFFQKSKLHLFIVNKMAIKTVKTKDF